MPFLFRVGWLVFVIFFVRYLKAPAQNRSNMILPSAETARYYTWLIVENETICFGDEPFYSV